MGIKLIQPLVKDLVEKINYLESQKTNYVSKIFQNIVYEQTSQNTFTLKKGSKLYKGDGISYTLQSDLIFNATNYGSTHDNMLMFYSLDSSALYLVRREYVKSGPTDTTGGTKPSVWFNTSNKKIIIHRPDRDENVCLPIGVFNVVANTSITISQIFNGFGYMGSVPYRIDFDAKLSNGFNSEGSYNNIDVNARGVFIHPNLSSNIKCVLQAVPSGNLTTTSINNIYRQSIAPTFQKSSCWYDIDNNVIWKSVSNSVNWFDSPSSKVVDVGYLETDSTGQIVVFKPNQTICLADDQAVLHKDIDEAINSLKNIKLDKATHLILTTTNLDASINPSSDTYTNYIDSHDKNGKLLTRIYTRRTKDGKNAIAIQAFSTDGSRNYSILIDDSGNASVPYPASGLGSDNSQPVNTQWFNDKIQVVATLPSSPDANVFYFCTNA